MSTFFLPRRFLLALAGYLVAPLTNVPHQNLSHVLEGLKCQVVLGVAFVAVFFSDVFAELLASEKTVCQIRFLFDLAACCCGCDISEP